MPKPIADIVVSLASGPGSLEFEPIVFTNNYDAKAVRRFRNPIEFKMRHGYCTVISESKS